MEDELQRAERMLYERDQEIARLRRVARELEASQLQADMELRGLTSAKEAVSSEARVLGAGISDLLSRLESIAGTGPRGPSQHELELAEEARRLLLAKQEEHLAIRGCAEAAAAETRRLEAEETHLAQLVATFDLSLQAKRKQIETEDQKLIREGAAVREHCAELRRALQREQRDATGMDQRAELQSHCRAEAEGVHREASAILQAMPALAARLRTGGRSVYSLMVPGDPVDERLHAFLRSCGGATGNPAPVLICRLGPKDYVIDGVRVSLTEAQGELVVQEATGLAVGLRAFLERRAPQQRPLQQWQPAVSPPISDRSPGIVMAV